MRVIASVFDKRGLADFGKGLASVETNGTVTAQALSEVVKKAGFTATLVTPDTDRVDRDSNASTAKKAGSGTKVNPSNSTGKKEIKTQNTAARKKSRRTEAQRIITVHVKGLSCPFCVLGIEKRLKAISSVATISSNWGKGEMYVKLKAGRSVSDDDLRRAIKRAGFTLGEIDRSAGEGRKDSR